MASLQLTKPSNGISSKQISANYNETNTWLPETKPIIMVPQQQFKPLEDDHIEQMIEELLDYGSIELCCSVMPPQK